MFYAAVEIRDNPEIEDKPVVVVGNNMITAANYVARKFGIKSGTPLYKGRMRCSNLTIVPSNMEKYKEVAREVREVLGEYDDKMETKGLDEAYLLVTPILIRRRMNTDAGKSALAEEIRAKIYAKTRLTSSAGIGCNKLLAKICSEVNKPNGQFYLPPVPSEIRKFTASRKVRDIPGVGHVLEQLLASLGISTCKQVIDDQLKVYAVFPSNVCTFLFNSALGIGTIDHSERVEDQRTISACRSFPVTSDPTALEEDLRGFCKQVSAEMKSKGATCRTVTVFLKNAVFQEFSRYFPHSSETSTSSLSAEEEVWRVASRILRSLYPLQPVRNLGVRVSQLQYREAKPAPGTLVQKQLFDLPPPTPVKARKRKPIEEEDLFQSIMSHSILPSEKVGRASILQRRKCPVCNQQFTANEELAKMHMEECARRAAEGPQKRKPGLFTGLF